MVSSSSHVVGDEDSSASSGDTVQQVRYPGSTADTGPHLITADHLHHWRTHIVNDTETDITEHVTVDAGHTVQEIIS